MLNQSIESLISAAIAARIFPGAVVLVDQAGRIAHHAAYGTTMYDDPGSQAVAHDAIFDLASLTKLFTATAALRLLDAGLLNLEREARHYLPALQAHGVTLQHLLTHTSGLDLRLSTMREDGAPAIRRAIYAAVPLRPPGSAIVYTNIGSTLMGEIVSVVYGGSLDAAISELITTPLGMGETCFNPPAAWHGRIPPTEWDDQWRGGLVQGLVHDESACAMGGVAGHAGLFGSANDVLRFARMWLQGGAWAGRQFLREQTVALALCDYTGNLSSPTGQALRAGLGWMLERPYFMGLAPPGTAGHTGFTGPILVICPALDSCVIMLCNRTYPRRTPPPYRHHAVMARLCDLIINR